MTKVSEAVHEPFDAMVELFFDARDLQNIFLRLDSCAGR